MRKHIKTSQSMAELCDYLQAKHVLLEKKNSDFINEMIQVWDERILSKKLIEFHEEELAQQIDSINPNQSRQEICKAIYAIIVQPKTKQESNEPFDYDIGESYTSGIEWGVYL